METPSFKSVAEIRTAFLNFFKSKEHQILPGGSLIPNDDPSLLFTNAGMNQFKKSFLGYEDPPAPAVATAQWCLRAGGKHNDLENIGHTFRHHTLFEMLGNFSFGGYSKQRAIELAWTFLTHAGEGLGISPERLWITVYSKDEETFEIWHQLAGVRTEQIVRIGDRPGEPYNSDNFWKMGESGPCGPSTEIFYDYGPEFEGTPPGPEQTGERFIEIWNLVFMQFNQTESKALQPLSKLGIDTGMGLERIAALLQKTHDNYQTDLFIKLMQKAAALFNFEYDPLNVSLRIIADHCRAIAFLLAENLLPDNQGRGYVLRRIIRRAMLQAHKLGAKGPKLFQLMPEFCKTLQESGVKIFENVERIQDRLHKEEVAFYKTLAQGLMLFEQKLDAHGDSKIFSGLAAFQLYDTYGFPLEITEKLCEEHGLTVDHAEFESAILEQKARSKQHQKFEHTQGLASLEEKLQAFPETLFLGYDRFQCTGKILAIFNLENEEIAEVSESKSVKILLDQTTFYPEGGGQPSDSGTLYFQGGSLEVLETQKIQNKILHWARLSAGISCKKGMEVETSLNLEKRQALTRHHSAAHLLHAVAKEIVGPTLLAAGASIYEEHFRFDVELDRAFAQHELVAIANRMNERIQACLPVTTEISNLETALKRGACALFESKNKYKGNVRSVEIEGVSLELCGGTHVRCTGELGLFVILAEKAVAKGVRRLEACCGQSALNYLNRQREALSQLSKKMNCSVAEFPERIEKLVNELKSEKASAKEWKAMAASFFLKKVESAIERRKGLRSFCGITPLCDANFFQNVARLSLHHTIDLLILIRPIDEGFEIFCAQTSSFNLNLLERIESMLKKIGKLSGGGQAFKKVLTLRMEPTVEEEEFLKQMTHFLDCIQAEVVA